MLSTSNYIYNNLFQHGQDYDIIVTALETSWKLHKFYLKQTQYFDALFSRWSKSQNGLETAELELDIPDPLIDSDALNQAFGSLYCDEIDVEAERAVNVLAAASLLQHQGLIQHCNTLMKGYLGSSTVIDYLNAATMYGLPELESASIQWLEYNLMLENSTQVNIEMLRGIEPELMATIINSPELAVIQVETDVYQLLKKWLLVHLDTLTSSTSDSTRRLQRFRVDNKSVLASIDEKYQAAFRRLRLCHVVTDFKGAMSLESENIIPKCWITLEYRNQWLRMLRVESASDDGPSTIICDKLQEFDRLYSTKAPLPETTLTALLKSSMRCGRVLDRSKDFCWRWTGYNYGFDLVMQYNHKRRSLHINRNCRRQDVNTSVSMKKLRSLICKIKVFSQKDDGSMDLAYSSGWRYYELEPDQDQMVYYDWWKGTTSKKPPKLYLTANIILADSAETSCYLPRSMSIRKFTPESGSSRPSSTAHLHGNSI